VHPDNWDAFILFDQLGTQWRIIPGMSGVFYQGLDYAAVMAVVRETVKGRKNRARTFDQIRLIEAGALSVINDAENVSDNAANSG